MDVSQSQIVALGHLEERQAAMERDVREGLVEAPRRMPPKYFYDGKGSELFDAITRLEEYYLTRCEVQILEEFSSEFIELSQPAELVEIGSGVSRKTRILLEAMHAEGVGSLYAPLDVSRDALEFAMRALQADYSWLRFQGYRGDFHQHLHKIPRTGRRLLAFLGSTIGNLDQRERASFLQEVARSLHEQDRFLLGVDLVKEASMLEKAYNDAEGLSAQFNLNMLAVLKRELQAKIPLEHFEHRAIYNESKTRVEMWLVPQQNVVLEFPSLKLSIPLARDEGIRTEISCKFTQSDVEQSLQTAGLELELWKTDPKGLFAMALAKKTQ